MTQTVGGVGLGEGEGNFSLFLPFCLVPSSCLGVLPFEKKIDK